MIVALMVPTACTSSIDQGTTTRFDWEIGPVTISVYDDLRVEVSGAAGLTTPIGRFSINKVVEIIAAAEEKDVADQQLLYIPVADEIEAYAFDTNAELCAVIPLGTDTTDTHSLAPEDGYITLKVDPGTSIYVVDCASLNVNGTSEFEEEEEAGPEPTSGQDSAPDDQSVDDPGEPDPDSASLQYQNALASAYSGRCIQVEGESLDDGARVIQWGLSWEDSQCGGQHEQWSWVGGYGADGTGMKLVNKNSGKCLDVAGASTTEGAGLVQNTCQDSGGSQIWYRSMQGVDNGWQYFNNLRNDRSGMCMDPGGQDSAGSQIIQMPCSTEQSQQFRERH
ncbi:RICIN domain-containing protein [Glycomyces sp. NRRL B-16210]|uniref:RICIN domain-containing protein n=1 Tax=Glycomyces sp. NRRL B-16210 TaxID=1463821 RepID=UPI0004C18FD7|nr:RICIN domain-containing protein [Glycomyces sp. NRRL B-16210]